MNIYVNGKPVPHRLFTEAEHTPVMRHDDGLGRVFYVLEPSDPCAPEDDITCDEVPADIDQVWVRVPCLVHGNRFHGNMRIHP